MKILVLSANLGGFDKPVEHAPQSLKADYHTFTDENFPPRSKSMTLRLQSKIPKFFGWQLIAGYDYYVWLDANFALAREDSLKYLIDSVENYDIAVFKHPVRPNIKQEVRYTRKGIKQGSQYMVGRYTGEYLKEQYRVIAKDIGYEDNLLVCGGVFVYRNIPSIQAMFKEWWYHVSRYIVEDQISFPYALKKSGVRVNVLTDNIYDTPYLVGRKHIYHGR